jgi:aminoglycoside phosphotransferase (APT) family kinase protein
MFVSLGTSPNRGPPLATIDASATAAGTAAGAPARVQEDADDELLRMFDAPSPCSSPQRASFGELSSWDAMASGPSTPPVTPVKLARASLSWGSSSGGSSDSEAAMWSGVNHAAAIMSPASGERVMQERLAEVPRAVRRLVPGWRECLAVDVQPLSGASGCAFRLSSMTNGTFFVRLLRSTVSRDSRLVGVTGTAAAAGLTPAVVGADSGAMVQQWCDGSAPDPQQYREPEHARRLGDLIAMMHALPNAPATAETRAATAAAAAAAATHMQRTISLTQTMVGMSLTFEAPSSSTPDRAPSPSSPPFGATMAATASAPAAGCGFVAGSGMQRSLSSGALTSMPRVSALKPPISPSTVNTTLPSAVYGPLQRNGVDMLALERTWRASENLQAAQLQPSIAGAAGTLVWTHGDLHFQNLLQTCPPQAAGAASGANSCRRLLCIDLETVAQRPAASDLTNLIRYWKFPPLATRRALVEGYLARQAGAAAGAGGGGVMTAVDADAVSSSKQSAVDAMLWAIECCMPVCLMRWIVMVMTAPDANGGDPATVPRVRQALVFVPLLAPAVATLRGAAGVGGERKRQEIIERGIWPTVGLPPLDQIFCDS